VLALGYDDDGATMKHPLLDGIPAPPSTGRRPLDAYETPPWATEALLDDLPCLTKTTTVIEPCAGDLAIVRVLASHVGEIITRDINPLTDAVELRDATEPWPRILLPTTWVITNPPYNVAYAIMMAAWNAYGTLEPNIALLLRLSWLEPTVQKREFLVAHPPDRLIVLPRHSYTGTGKTDSVTSAWMIWSPLVAPGIRIVLDKRRSRRGTA